MKYLFEHKYLDENDIKNLSDKNYCKNTFNLSFPMFSKKTENIHDQKGHPRYWREIFDNKYYVCNHWYKKQTHYFEAWYSSIINKVTIR